MARILIWLTDWLIDHGAFGKTGPERLNTGKYAYTVQVCRTGRMVEVVLVRADDPNEAGDKAVRYVRANLYALSVR